MTFPPGWERLARGRRQLDQLRVQKRWGWEAVAFFNVVTAAPYATIRSTFFCTNSAAISATRSGHPPTSGTRSRRFRPSIEPSSFSRSAKAANHEM